MAIPKRAAGNFRAREEVIFSYIEAAFENGDPATIKQALGNLARARGMTATARSAGVTREALYKALSIDGDPRLSTLIGVMRALGLKLTAQRRLIPTPRAAAVAVTDGASPNSVESPAAAIPEKP